MRELQEAKAEGVVIPQDIEKRLEQFEENGSNRKGKTLGKIHPDETAGGDGKVHVSHRSHTRYMARNSVMSAHSNQKLIQYAE